MTPPNLGRAFILTGWVGARLADGHFVDALLALAVGLTFMVVFHFADRWLDRCLTS